MTLYSSVVCESCWRAAPTCEGCGARQAEVHNHVYDEWFCRPCWAVTGEPDESQAADLYRVGPFPPASGS